MTPLPAFRHVLMALFFIAVSAIPVWAKAQNTLKSVVTTDLVRAELMGYAPDGADPGKPVWVGLQLSHQPHWHSYWKNSGDSGQPTSLSWTLPVGVLAGDIAWPLPQKLPIGNLANYGYEGVVLLPVPLTITPDFKPGLLAPELEVKLQATWLVCREECVPQEGEFVLRLPVKGSTALNAAEFQAAFKAQPKALAGVHSSAAIEGRHLKLSVAGLPASLHGKTLEFYPETPEVIETAAQWTQSWQGPTWTASVPVARHRSADPDTLALVLAAELAGQRSGFSTLAKISGNWPLQAMPGALPATATSDAAAATPVSFWLALLGALLGGMMLNLMPCVFPVLAIKLLSFARHAEDRRGHRLSGLAYSTGVLLSFLALGTLMLTLRSAGEQLGWGFQLQSPGMVAALAVLFSLIGLNLAGLFEFGQWLPARLATLEAQNPAVNAFLSGILAVLIASPCTAPFMGASLGLALNLPALQALLIFAALGIGMALPYLAASWSPALARKLPRPGAWMNTLRRAMAFPMFATVVWLVWVLGHLSGMNGAGALLALLVAMALLVWSFGLKGRSRTVFASISIAAAAMITWAVGPFVLQMEPLTDAATISGSASSTTGPGWQAWVPGRVDTELAAGKAVFVDFTAAWCITCQYNKKTTLANTEVLADFAAKKVQLLRADWTRRDPAITQALEKLGRSGVPVYVLYQSDKAPVVFSEILDTQALRSAIAAL